MVRVEEVLKTQRELIRQGFEQMDKRFDELIRRHDRHFLWLIGFITTMSGVVVAAGRLL